MAPPSAADLVLRQVAASGFASRLPAIQPMDDVIFTEVLRRSYSTSLDGQMFTAFTSRALPLTDSQRERAAVQHAKEMNHALRVERELLRVVAELDHRGVDYRLMKGVALAHSLYPDPAGRTFADADLLVAPGQMSDAVDAVTSLGGRRNLPEVVPDHDSRFAKSVTLVVNRVALDLHRTLMAGPLGVTTPIDDLFSRGGQTEIGGINVRTLDRADMYLHATVTVGALDWPPRLVTMADMMHLESAAGFDPALILDRAAHWHVSAAVARAVGLVEQSLLPVAPLRLSEWAKAYRPSRREEWLLSSYLGAGRTYRRTLATLVVLRDWQTRLAFVRAISMPSPEYRRAREWSRAAHVVRAYKKLRGGPRRNPR